MTNPPLPSGASGLSGVSGPDFTTLAALEDLLRDRPAPCSRPGQRRIYYLVAPAGHPNWGDDLIAATWVRFLSRVRPDDTVVVDCHNPGKAGVLLRRLHPNLVVTNTLWEIMGRAQSRLATEGAADVSLTDLCALTSQWVRDVSEVADYATNIDLLHQADVLHLVGGGYLNNLWEHHAAFVAALIAVRDHATQCPPLVVATGQGLSPAQPETLHYLTQADVVTVRDQPSLQLLQDAGAGRSGRCAYALVGDDAWLAVAVGRMDHYEGRWTSGGRLAALRHRWAGLQRRLPVATQVLTTGRSQPEGRTSLRMVAPGTRDTAPQVAFDVFPYHPAPEGRRTVLCVQYDLVEDPQQLWQWVRETLHHWQVTGEELLVVEALPYGDYVVWEQVISQEYPEAEFMPFARLWAEGLPVGEDVRWLSTRFHPHLLAAAAGCAGVAVDAHAGGYYAVKHASVQAAGSLWPVVSPLGEGAAVPGECGAPAPHPTETIDVSQRETQVLAAVRLAEALYPPRRKKP